MVIQFWQLVCLATFLKVSENDTFDPYQVILLCTWNIRFNFLSVFCIFISFFLLDSKDLFFFLGTAESFDWVYRCCWTVFCIDAIDSQKYLAKSQIPGCWTW